MYTKKYLILYSAHAHTHTNTHTHQHPHTPTPTHKSVDNISNDKSILVVLYFLQKSFDNRKSK